MKRKINKVGNNTLTVSLPAKWARKYNVNAGDELDLYEDGNKLILGGSLKQPKKEVTISIKGADECLGRFICASYVKGYDTINIKFEENGVFDKILNTSKILMGFEIVEHTKNSCKLVNVSTKLEQNFDVLLNRLFLIGIAFEKELLSRLKSGADIKNLMEYETNANRLAMFCQRAIQTNNAGELTYSTTTLYSLVTLLEESVDPLRNIIEMLGNTKVKLNKETIALFEKSIQMQEITYNIFSKISKGEQVQAQLGLYKEHKTLRQSIYHNPTYLKGDKLNSYICAQLMSIVDFSHHISQELVR